MRASRFVVLILLCSSLASTARAASFSLGAGVHYWRTVNELGNASFDRSGAAVMLSYQYLPEGLFKLEGDVEFFPRGFGGANDAAWSPQVYFLVGGRLYAGVGAGVIYSSSFDGRWSDVFYAARAGTDFALLPRVHLDINANYRFNDWNQLDQANTDTVTLGALLRLRF
jgi:opacity protein-like surface antigen